MNPHSTLKLVNLLKNNIAPKEYLTVSEIIANEYFAEGDIVTAYIKACLDTASVKNRSVGVKAPAERVNTVMYFLADYAAVAIRDLGYALATTERAISNLSNSPDIMDKWILPKYHILRSKIQLVMMVVEWMENSNYKKVVNIAEKYGSYRDLKSSTSDMFKEMLTLQTYGIKPCAFEDAVFGNNKRYWVYNPQNFIYQAHNMDTDVWSKADPQFKIREQIARHTTIATVNIDAQKDVAIASYDTGVKSAEGKTMAGYQINTYMVFDIGFDGALYVWNCPSISLEKIALRLNLAPVYEVLRMNAIMRLYDLIIPLKVLKEGPRMPYVKKFLNFVTNAGSLDPTLILKRIRTIFENKQEIIMELDREVDNATQKPGSIKIVKDVVWHTRMLPEGYKASANAKALAKEYLDRELLPGETFVVAHKRNIGGLKQNTHVAKVVR